MDPSQAFRQRRLPSAAGLGAWFSAFTRGRGALGRNETVTFWAWIEYELAWEQRLGHRIFLDQHDSEVSTRAAGNHELCGTNSRGPRGGSVLASAGGDRAVNAIDRLGAPASCVRKWLLVLGALGSATLARPASGAESEGAATQREGQFMAGVGHGSGRYQGVSPFRWGVFLRAGYTAANGVYVGVMGDAYSGESSEQADGHTDLAMVGLGAEVGYDLRVGERWTLRFALLNAAGALETIECSQLEPPPSMETCADAEYSWNYEIGPSVQALYLWEKALFFSELRQASYLSSSAAIFSVTAIVGFGFHF